MRLALNKTAIIMLHGIEEDLGIPAMANRLVLGNKVLAVVGGQPTSEGYKPTPQPAPR